MEIPTEVTEQAFHQYIDPHLSTTQHGYVSKEPLWKIFNYVLYKLHTGCQ